MASSATRSALTKIKRPDLHLADTRLEFASFLISLRIGIAPRVTCHGCAPSADRYVSRPLNVTLHVTAAVTCIGGCEPAQLHVTGRRSPCNKMVHPEVREALINAAMR